MKHHPDTQTCKESKVIEQNIASNIIIVSANVCLLSGINSSCEFLCRRNVKNIIILL